MLKKWFKEYIQINEREILTVIGLLITGVIMGVIIYFFVPVTTKQQMLMSAKEVFEISKSETYVKTNIIANGIKTNVLLIGILAVFSITLFGKWLIYTVVLLKGTAIAVYTTLLFSIFGPVWGLVTAILLVILVNILYIPAFIYLTVSFLEINFNIFKVKLRESEIYLVYKMLLTIFCAFILMFSSIVIEQIASSVVLNIYSNIT